MKWFEKHLNWTLLLGVIGAPFLLFWIIFGIVNLILLFSPYVGALIGSYVVPASTVLYILIPIVTIAWYIRERRKKH